MKASRPFVGVLAGFFFAIPFAHASVDELINNSPFAGPGIQAAAAQATPGSIELRGIIRTGETWEFSIYDPSRKYSAWVKLGQIGDDFVVKNYDPDHDSATVEYQGRTLKLSLPEAKIAPMNGAMQQPMPPPNLAMGQPQPGQPQPGAPTINQSSADEQKRLEAIAEEIRRRRAMRQQAATPQQPAPR